MVQPMLTKALLPAFGGSYLVWGSAMVFFQAVLLAGYILGHVLQNKFGVKRYGYFHLGLLCLPFFWFPFRFEMQAESTHLVAGVFEQLSLVVGIPFLFLSMTSVVLQRWLIVSPLQQRQNPYVLYAVSNIGSVMALLAYPFVIEPISSFSQQSVFWWICYAVLVLMHYLAFPWQSTGVVPGDSQVREHIGILHRMRWFGLSLASGSVLLATTNVITFDIASVPLLWVLPLALFLLAYVVVFKKRPWCPMWMEGCLNWVIILAGCLTVMMRLGVTLPLAVGLPLYLVILFVCCLNCNIWLHRTKPQSGKELTGFYVVIAAGGLCGSLIVSWLLPIVTTSLLEYPIGILLTTVAIAFTLQKNTLDRSQYVRMAWFAAGTALWLIVPSAWFATYPEMMLFVLICLPFSLYIRACKAHPWVVAFGLICLIFSVTKMEKFAHGGAVIARLRNYYGIYQVFDQNGIRYLQHGTTQHGRQYLEGESRSTPLAYYHPSTPIGRFFESDRVEPSSVGMIGLGAGAIASYMHEGQELHIFELDPDNEYLAKTYFGYLAQGQDQGATLHFTFGDGRIQLDTYPNYFFDVLVLDAFNSGSIPVHLLTVEALQLYMDKLKPDGILLLHLSNRVLNLLPVVYANVADIGLYARHDSNASDVHADAEFTVWMAVSRAPEAMALFDEDLDWNRGDGMPTVEPWTDRYSNLPGAVRWL